VICVLCGDEVFETEAVATAEGPICRACDSGTEEPGKVAAAAVWAIGLSGLAMGGVAGWLTWNPLFVLAGIFAVVSAWMAAALMT
jgi:hypothetical protein